MRRAYVQLPLDHLRVCTRELDVELEQSWPLLYVFRNHVWHQLLDSAHGGNQVSESPSGGTKLYSQLAIHIQNCTEGRD